MNAREEVMRMIETTKCMISSTLARACVVQRMNPANHQQSERRESGWDETRERRRTSISLESKRRRCNRRTAAPVLICTCGGVFVLVPLVIEGTRLRLEAVIGTCTVPYLVHELRFDN